MLSKCSYIQKLLQYCVILLFKNAYYLYLMTLRSQFLKPMMPISRETTCACHGIFTSGYFLWTVMSLGVYTCFVIVFWPSDVLQGTNSIYLHAKLLSQAVCLYEGKLHHSVTEVPVIKIICCLFLTDCFLFLLNALHFPTRSLMKSHVPVRLLDGWTGCIMMYSLQENLFLIHVCCVKVLVAKLALFTERLISRSSLFYSR